MSARDRILAKLRGARPAEPLAHPDPAPHYAAREDQDAGRASASLPGEHLATFLLRRTGGSTT